MTPEERALRVVRAARELESDALVEDVARASGLSIENVRLGFARHLELDPSRAEIEALVRSSVRAERANVILSSTVFVGALRAIAWAWAGAPRVVVRPSRREPHFARALVRAVDHPSVTLDEALDPARAEGTIHVYGRSETIEAVRARARAPVIAHGPGVGVAIVRGDLERAARDLAWDVIPFDQRGCLSPRLVVVLGDEADALRLAELVVRAVDDAKIARGALSDAERAEAARWSRAVQFAWHLVEGRDARAGVGARSLGPVGRHLPITFAADFKAILAPIMPFVTAIGTNVEGVSAPHARVSPLGSMQRPPLDGPVDLRPAITP